MVTLTVNQFISYFGGYDRIVIEEQTIMNKEYWRGTVDQWLVKSEEWLENKEVVTASVVDGKLIIRVFGDDE